MTRIRLAAALIAATLMIHLSCGRTAPSGAEESLRKRLLADAPADFNEFLSWAWEVLQRTPEPVPPIDTPPIEPRWPVIRLYDDAEFRRAQRFSNWKPSEDSDAPLASIGPFRTDRRDPRMTAQVLRGRTSDARDAIGLTLSGFQVQREDVGMIRLKMKLPFGERFLLRWSRAGEIMLLRPGDDLQTYSVLTEGFADWEGPLENIELIIDDVAEGVVEIESLEFLPRTNAYPHPLGRGRVGLRAESRYGIYAHAPAKLQYLNLNLPAEARLHTGLGLFSPDGTPAEARFLVQVEADGRSEVVLDRSIAAGDAWHDVRADLSAFGGGRAQVSLIVESPRSDLVALWGAPTIYQPVENAPFVIVYLIDTLAAEHVALYGYNRPTMPTLGALAREGVWFPRMVSNSSRTVESVPDLLLGLHTDQHGVHHNMTPAAHEYVSLAERLGEAGFATASFFTNVYAGPRQNMDQGFQTLVDRVGFWWSEDERADRTVPLDETLDWIEQHADRPMFMYIHTAEPHAPYTPPPGFSGRFDPDYSGIVDGSYDRTRGFRSATRTQRDLAHVVALYDEEILYSDARLGMFLDGVRQRGLDQRLNIVITSDHGEEFTQHGFWEHGLNLHNEQTRVPLVMHGPLFGRWGLIDAPAQLLDVKPTLLELLEVAPPAYALPGRSLAGAVRATADATARETVVQRLSQRTMYLSNHHYRSSQPRCIEYAGIDGRWKLMAAALPGGPRAGRPPGFMLFDIGLDPRERNDLLQREPARARGMIEDLLVWRHSHPPYDVKVQAVTDVGQMEALAAMGYVDLQLEVESPD